MSEFSISKGSSENIGLEATPFCDGRMYFAVDTRQLYVDVTVDGAPLRVLIGGEGSATTPDTTPEGRHGAS